MDPSIFKAYDIRGIYPTEINEIGATQIGRACAKLFKPGKIIIAHDVRHGSVELSKAITESITEVSNGQHEIVFVGLSTTPMFYFLVKELRATGGCMITASHNPKNYNGFKIVEEKAHVVSGIAVRDIIESLQTATI
jgi:phosphomannomutase